MGKLALTDGLQRIGTTVYVAEAGRYIVGRLSITVRLCGTLGCYLLGYYLLGYDVRELTVSFRSHRISLTPGAEYSSSCRRPFLSRNSMAEKSLLSMARFFSNWVL